MPSALGDLKGLLPQLNETSQYRVIDAYYAWERGRTTDDNRAPPVQRTVWILLAISTIVIFTRLVVKLRTTRRLYLDDALMILALVSCYTINSPLLSTS
jgi:nicotinamide riboside transporter PnuC